MAVKVKVRGIEGGEQHLEMVKKSTNEGRWNSGVSCGHCGVEEGLGLGLRFEGPLA